MAPQPVRDLTMRGRYDSTQARFDLDEARVSLGSEEAPGPVLNIAGIFDHDLLSRGWLIDADATLEDVPAAELDTYWPRSVADNAREWVVENVTQGRVDRAPGALDVTVPAGEFSHAQITASRGTHAYRAVAGHHTGPPVPVP